MIDAHVLLGRDDWLYRRKRELACEAAVADLRSQLLGIGCEWVACAAPFPSSRDGTYCEENRYLLEAGREDPRVRPVLGVNPRLDASRQFVEDALRGGAPIAALAIWPILCGLDLVDLAADDWLLGIAAGYDVPLNVHTGAGNEARIGRVSQLGRYCPEHAIALAAARPEVRFNLSHALRLSQSALREAQLLPNVFTDLSGVSSHRLWFENGMNVFAADDAGELADLDPPALIEALVHDFGLADRLLFGTSYPFNHWWGMDIPREFELVGSARLTEAERAAVLHRNARELFRALPPEPEVPPERPATAMDVSSVPTDA